MPQISANTNLQNSYVEAIALRTSVLLASRFILPAILAPIEDLRPERVGNEVRVLRDPKGTVRDVVDDRANPNTTDAPTQNSDTVTLDYYRTVGFKWGQKDQVIAQPEITINRYANSGAKQLGSDIESKTLSDIANDPNIPVDNEVGTVGVAMNRKTLSSVVEKFIENEVDMEDRVLILSPRHYKECLDNDVFVSEDFVTKGAIESGVLTAQLYGMTIYVSPRLDSNDNLTSVTGTDTNRVSLALDKKAVLFTMAQIEEPAGIGATFAQESIDGMMTASYLWFNADTRTNQLAMDALWGVKVVKNPTTINANDVTNVFVLLGGTV